MRTRTDRLLHGPSVIEVCFGAVLSVVLGIALAVTILVLKPVTTARELPKEPMPDTVYYLEGSHNPAKARQVAAKTKLFLQGSSIALDENELNALAALKAKPVEKPAAVAPVDKDKPSEEPPASAPLMSPGELNFRIREGVAQVALPLTFNLLGLEQTVMVQARGTFVKDGDRFVFDPTEAYLGSCPLHRLPPVRAWFLRRIWTNMNLPEDLVASWDRLSEVTIDGSTLHLTMP